MSMFRKESPNLVQIVSDLEQAVRDRDPQRSEDAFSALYSSFQEASEADSTAAGPRLAAILPDFPPTGPRGILAVMTGACIERGADPIACGGPLLDGVAETLRDALVFALAWQQTGGGELPDPDSTPLDDAVIGRLVSELGEPYAAHRAAMAWWSMPQWEMAAVAVLSSSDARRRIDPELRNQLIGLVEQLRELQAGDFKCLYYALLVLDDEDIVVLHRPTGTGYRVRISGLGDNFQLHTLLGHALVGGGHVPGTAPSPEVVAVSVDRQVPPGTRLDTVGAFNLVSPFGEWVWNEGTPSDIPVVDGVRLLVLDPPPYQRGWNAGRFFPGMTGSLALTQVLTPEETQYWFGHVKPASGPS